MTADEQKDLVAKHLWLVPVLARQFPTDSLPWDDIIQEGNLGMIHAAGKFKPELGIQFSTYAGHWICCYIRRALYRNRTVQIPEWAIFERAKVLRALDDENQSLDLDELAKASKYSADTVKWLVENEFSIRSMDADINLDGGMTLHDIVSNNVSIKTDRMIDSRIQWLDVLDAVSQLPERQQFVIRKRFTGNGATLQEVGELLNGMSRERVRQIQEDAIQNIRRILSGI